MISRIRGTLLRRELGTAEVMTTGGVAYQLHVPLSVFERLPREGEEVELRCVHVVREDAMELYGFIGEAERVVFARLLTASGVGPRLALSMLSTLSPERVVRAILDRDIATLRQIPGLGAKKAERLSVELADRMDDVAVQASTAGGPQGAEEAVAALVALGYPSSAAASAVRKVIDDNDDLAGVDLIRSALAAVEK